MKRKPIIRKPTHRLEKDGVVYALIRCGDGRPAIKLLSTGETERSHSGLCDSDLIMGRWQNAMLYMFGADDHVPLDAVMVPIV